MQDEVKLFLLWDTQEGEPPRDKAGRITTDGSLGLVLTEQDAFLTKYAHYPDARRPKDLKVDERIRDVTFTRGTRDLIRVA